MSVNNLFKKTRKGNWNKKCGGIRKTLELARKICDFSACRKPSVFVQKGAQVLHPPAVRKGFMYTLEAMIAAMLIMATLVAVFSYSKQQEGFEAVAIKDRGYSCMVHLDSQGLLRYYALANDTASIRSHFQNCIGRNLNFSVSFCSACAPDIPGNRTIISVNYLIAGEAEVFRPTNANLFLWSLV